MKSSYKILGDFIRPVNNRNKGLITKDLRGLSMSKEFRKSTSNIVGTDLTKYKLVYKNQFACDFMSVIRVHKLPVVKHDEDQPVIVSPAYSVFEVIDENILDPQYLMMWFRRPEFDRYADFRCDSAIRGGFKWDELCEVELPIPSIDKQRAIVAEYNTIVDRIQLNEQLNQKLEETAQAIYKQWFVDFEFPKIKVDGMLRGVETYRNSGGKMVYNEELEKEIPEGWEVVKLEEVISEFISKRGKSKSVMNLNKENEIFKYPVISAMNVNHGAIVKKHTIPYVNKEDYNNWMNPKLEIDDLILTSEAPLGETFYIARYSDFALSQRLFGLRTRKDIMSGWYLNFWLNLPSVKRELEERSSGTTVSGIKLSELKKLSVLVPSDIIEQSFNSLTINLASFIEVKRETNEKLKNLSSLFLSKMMKVEVNTEKEII